MRILPLRLTCFAIVGLLLCGLAALGISAESNGEALRPHRDLPPGRTDHAARLIDEYFQSYWLKAGVAPAALIDDTTFLRRASLAVLGRPADADEVRAFLADARPNKRDAKVDEFLVESRYADYWGFRLRHWLTDLREVKGQGANTVTLYRYTREAMAENRSWARIADDMVNSRGHLLDDGNANFGIYFSGEPNEMADGAARLFLGVKISCSQCHDDPFHEAWTRRRYWSLAAFFGRTEMINLDRPKPEALRPYPSAGRSEASVATLPGGDAAVDGEGGEKRAIIDVDQGEVLLGGRIKFGQTPAKGQQPLMPAPLGEPPLNNCDRGGLTRRRQFVAWMTRKDNPFFARAAVNRMFLELTGRGFAASADGLNPGDEILHKPLLDRLAREFAERDYDLKWLIRTIVDSRAFQLAPPDARQTDGEHHWHYATIRLLNGDQWHDSVLRVTGREKQIWASADAAAAEFDLERNERLAKRRTLLVSANKVLTAVGEKERAAALPSPDSVPAPTPVTVSDADRKRLEEFRRRYRDLGRELRESRHRARMKLGPTGEALMRMNSSLVSDSLRNSDTPQETCRLKTPNARLDAVFMQVLGRLPRDDERRRLAGLLGDPAPEKVTDLMWALMQSTEFLTY